jgi:protein phosphatase
VDRRDETGPFDIVGDVHVCADELRELLLRLGYAPDAAGAWRHPRGRRVVFVGDLVDRGPAVAEVLDLVMRMHAAGTALCVPGNHDDRLLRRLRGRNVVVAHGLQQSLDSLAGRPAAFSQAVARFLDGLPSHLVLDGGALVVAHAGMVERLQGRDSRRVRDFALYGDTTGEVDELGLPVRRDWAATYHGRAAVVYGHTPVARPMWVNATIDVDTGCVFGGALTALRWPERETVCVRARRAYVVLARPLPERAGAPAVPSAQAAREAAEHAQHEDEEERRADRGDVHPESAGDPDP